MRAASLIGCGVVVQVPRDELLYAREREREREGLGVRAAKSVAGDASARSFLLWCTLAGKDFLARKFLNCVELA